MQRNEQLFLRALELNVQALVSIHPQAATARYEFALLRQAQGHDEEARSLYERAPTARTHMLGAAHPLTIDTRKRLIALYDLRHRFGYRMAESVPLHRLAQIMGHDSLDTTKLYIQGTKHDLQQAVETIAWT